MGEFKRTVFFQENKIQGAKFVEFAGYEMPVMYTGIIDQHLATRKRTGLFDSKDRNHFQAILSNFEEVEFLKVSQDVAMLTLQSSNSRRILNAVLQSGHCLNRCAMLSVSLALTAVRSKSPEPVIPLSHWASNCP